MRFLISTWRDGTSDGGWFFHEPSGTISWARDKSRAEPLDKCGADVAVQYDEQFAPTWKTRVEVAQ